MSSSGAVPDQVVFRPRVAADLPGCVTLLEETHRVDGYPRFGVHTNAEFLTKATETDAWVAERDGVIIGHVALHTVEGHVVLAAARRSTGLPPDRFAVVARLLVSTQARGLRVGRRLLDLATDTAARRGQRAVLDVVRDAPGVVALYERAGWTRIGAETIDLGTLGELDVWVYLSPPPVAAPA